MRFISTENILQGMKLAMPIYNSQGEILLKDGNRINEGIIQRIKEIGFNGIFIDDYQSQGLIANKILDDSFKYKMAANLKETSNKIRTGALPDRLIRKLKDDVDEIINMVIYNKNRMLNVSDIKIFGDYPFYHAVFTSLLSIMMGFELKLNRLDLFDLGQAGLFHDIGKMFVQEKILNKKERLTAVEEEELRSHSYKSYKILRESNLFTSKCCVGVLDHHERFDGRGYPNKKRNKDITLPGRIITIVSAYDSLTSEKPYAKAKAPSEAMEYIMGGSGALFDPEFVQLFLRMVAPYPIGTLVELSNGVIGIVTENYKDCCMRPRIMAINDNNCEADRVYIDLKNDADAVSVTISRILS